MRCTFMRHEAPGGHGYHLNIVGATIRQHRIMDKLKDLSIVDIKIIAPAKLAEDEQASTNTGSHAIALRDNIIDIIGNVVSKKHGFIHIDDDIMVVITQRQAGA